MSEQRSEQRPNSVIGRPFVRGVSGNPGGRPKGIEAIAREHTPAAIAALVAALQNPRERVAAATVLLGYGWGKPVQAFASQDDAQSITFMHLVAARAASDELNRSRVIEGDAVATTTDRETIPFDLSMPALE
jgi:hypothetical protein